ncbi:MAG: mechanosensitive ion channel family protein [Flavobacteriales bacterium]
MNFEYDFQGKFNLFLEHLIDYSPRIILAILILWIGFLLIKKLMNYYNNKFTSKKISKELKPFLGNALNFSLRLLVIVIAIHVIGVKTSSFAALIAAVGFAIGMALQGSLGNLASGVMILIFKPYKVNDIVNIHKVEGIVEQIDIFNTIVITYDNRKVIIPNGQAINDIITNSTDKEYLRVDMFINLPYTENFERVQEIIKEAFLKTEKVLQTPEPFVGIEDFESHGMKVAIFPYCKPTDYWEVYYSSKASVKKALGENGIKMAYIEGVTFGEIAK